METKRGGLIVGREEERTSLVRFVKVPGERPQVLLLEGEAGIGIRAFDHG
jgi:hypothetical protein